MSLLPNVQILKKKKRGSLKVEDDTSPKRWRLGQEYVNNNSQALHNESLPSAMKVLSWNSHGLGTHEEFGPSETFFEGKILTLCFSKKPR